MNEIQNVRDDLIKRYYENKSHSPSSKEINLRSWLNYLNDPYANHSVQDIILVSRVDEILGV